MNDIQECNRCKKLKPLEEFHKDARLASGRRGICKVCKSPKATEQANVVPLAAVPKPPRPKLSDKELMEIRAQHRAIRQIIQRHPDEFEKILTKERQGLLRKPLWDSVTDL